MDMEYMKAKDVTQTVDLSEEALERLNGIRKKIFDEALGGVGCTKEFMTHCTEFEQFIATLSKAETPLDKYYDYIQYIYKS